MPSLVDEMAELTTEGRSVYLCHDVALPLGNALATRWFVVYGKT